MLTVYPRPSSRRGRLVALLSGSLLALLWGLPAGAQAGGGTGPNAAPPRSGTIETVIVTAQKIRTNLQKTPLAVSVLSSATLDHLNIVAPRDLDTIVPGLVVNTTPSNPLSISIRGAGYEGIENTSAQPGVSYNQNGVYIASPISLNANFLDVDSVEVLRGPQGTVLGQNSDGGAINVTTVRPQLGAYGGYTDFSYGSYNYDRFRIVGNFPLGETAAVRVALQQEAHDGWGNATQVPGTNGHYDLGDEGSLNARVDALWKPTGEMTVEVWAEHYSNDTNGDAFKNILDPNPDPRQLTQDYPTKMNQRSNNMALSVGYDLDWAVAKFIGSYQEGTLNSVENLDKLSYATAVPILGVHDIDVANDRQGHSYTAELDLTSKPGGPLDWIVGAFYLNQRYNEAVEEYQFNDNAANQAGFAQFQADYATALANPANLADQKAPGNDFNAFAAYGLPLNLSTSNPYYKETGYVVGPVAFETRDTQRLESASVYGQGTYHIGDRLRFTLGGRATTDNQIGVIQDYFGLLDRNNNAPFAVLKTGFRRMTGRAELEYDVTPDNTIYGMVSNGIKPGGANLNPQAVAVPLVFQPERVDAFEIGSKNEFLDRRLRLNVSAFYNMVHEFQVDSEDPIPFQGGLTNIKAAHVDGIEAEGTALLGYSLRADANLTVQGSQVDSHQQLLNPSQAEQIDIANFGPFNNQDVSQRFAAFGSPAGNVYGHTLPKVPPFTFNVALQHSVYFDGGGRLTSGIHFVYRNPYFFRVYDDPATDKVPPQRQIDLNFTYVAPGGHWHGDFIVTNLTDSASVNSRYSDNFGTFITANYVVPPRQFIGRIGYKF